MTQFEEGALARIYTATGDDGTTGLIGGKRVRKDSKRVEAYGSVDELNAVLGVVRSLRLPEPVARLLVAIQDDLFTIGANLAMPEGTDPAEWKIPPVAATDVVRLEKAIDEFVAELPPLQKFILPGGAPAAAMLHLARTVARRAERACVALSHDESLDQRIVCYLNRLSDLCFVLARFLNKEASVVEPHPTFGKPE
jgi:cob(I)alamin adenosyltransferase